MNESVDVLIIGAGPAGCSVAQALEGKSVLLVDTKLFPRDKPCSGLLVEESYSALKDMIPERLYGSPSRLPLRYIDLDNGIEVLQKRSLGNINRLEFDKWLLDSVGGGVEVWDKTVVTEIEAGDTIIVHAIRDGEPVLIKAKQLVGADGAISVTRRELGVDYPFRYNGEQDFITYDDNLNECQFIYWNKLTDWYSWVLPKWPRVIEVGGAFLPNADRDKLLFELKQKRGLTGRMVERKSWRLSQPRSLKDICLGNGKNIFLAGEAAGFVSPSTGEGISFGLRSGQLLGQAFKTGNPSRAYTNFVAPLVSEVLTKSKKAAALSNPVTRAALLKEITENG